MSRGKTGSSTPHRDAGLDSSPDANPDPWRVAVVVAQIPQQGIQRRIEANAREREALARFAALRDVVSAVASFELTAKSGGRVHVSGRLRARIGQTCVVSLEPIENDVDEEIDLMFAPAEEVRRLADLIDEGLDADTGPLADPPEAIVNGVIDLGRIATDVLCLAVDPYPRKEGAVFAAEAAGKNAAEHPFAALKALQDKEKS